MKNFIIYSLVFVSISSYFILTVFILPPSYLSNDQLIPQPYIETTLSNSEISLGESFTINVISENIGEYGDIHIVSVAFPDLDQIVEDSVEISTYDFTQSPVFILPGDEIGANYSGGLESVSAQYPSLEATSRPSHTQKPYHLEIIVTPEKIGDFSIFVKSIIIPHVSNISHVPESGILDHQNEYVSVYSVSVT